MAVYFIQAGEGGPVKIGHAEDPITRMAALQTAHHARLSLLAVMRGGRDEERELHVRLRPSHISGEWFEFTPELGILIAAHRYESPVTSPIAVVINRFGGNAAVARRFSVGLSAVSNWKARGKFPGRLHYKMDREANAEKFAIDPTLFNDEAA